MPFTPPVFAIFDLPQAERLPALRLALEQGASVMAINIRHECLLGRACRPAKDGTIDLDVIREILARGANPLRAPMWREETGEIEPLFSSCASLACNEPASPYPGVMRALLQACHAHDYRDPEGHDAFQLLIRSLRAYYYAPFMEPLRLAGELGFDLDQSIGKPASAIHFLLAEHASSQPMRGEWLWKVVELLIDGGIDMRLQDDAGRTCWDAIELCADHAAPSATFARIQANRQRDALRADTPLPTTPSAIRRM